MANKSFNARLKRLFSNGSVVRVVSKGSGKGIKVFDANSSQLMPKGSWKQRHASIYRTPGAQGRDQTGVFQATRYHLFRDYEGMDADPIIASAIDMYAEESSLEDEFGQILKITTSNNDVKQILHNLFYDILNINFNLSAWIRNLCKYGDLFLKLEIEEGIGVIDVIPLSVYEIIREEGYDIEDPKAVRFIHDISGATTYSSNQATTYDDYEMAHFRLGTDSNFLPYGKAIVENIRRIWKQIKLMEDAMMVHRIVRAPERRMYKVDIGNIPPKDVEGYMQRLMQKTKKASLMDPNTGEYNLKFNIQNLLEDFYLPVRGTKDGTSIENLPGLEYQTVEDIEYLQKKLFAGLKIPRAYLGYEEDTSGKGTLAQEDMRFARSIRKVQRIVVSELSKIAIVHLYANGYTDKELIDFSLELAMSSTVYEQEQIRIWQEKVRLGDDIKSGQLLSVDWIYETIFKLSEDDIVRERLRLVNDAKFKYRLDQIDSDGNDPAKSGQHVVGGQAIDPFNGEDEDSDDVSGFSGEDEDAEDFENDEKYKQGGRPRGNQTKYATDKHVLGRDPIGRNSISMNEIKRLIGGMNSANLNSKGLLDESNII